ncbi:hypothetical protein GCD22_02180 [Acidithiobacillus thiooxidans ATCC 19377]|uniref:Uncharacterized protein n=1 Tax=Acidithiobacillus thiooxidans ATCC 19377 TaxID=637390 RepID=A0A5P9XS39_ACITH|nr:hypothetical protein GCD22_02180 [Acidithiobacillus thiooxidans ATCC 19377]
MLSSCTCGEWAGKALQAVNGKAAIISKGQRQKLWEKPALRVTIPISPLQQIQATEYNPRNIR